MFVDTSNRILREVAKEPRNNILLVKKKKIKDDYSKQVRKTNWIAIGVAVGMLLFWTTALIFSKELSGSTLELTTFVELFNSVNTLFAGLALAGVVYAVLLQRIELRHNTFELTAQKLQFKKQNKILQSQKFESSFFQLLLFYNKLHDAVQYYTEGRTFLGAEAFEEIRIDLRRLSIRPLDNLSDYTDIVFQNTKGLRNYFNNLYNIIKFTHEDSIKEKDKYISIFRSQLSAAEHVLLFYDCLGSTNSKKFKPLMEEYALFEDMDCGLLLSYQHSNRYDIRAFGLTPPPK